MKILFFFTEIGREKGKKKNVGLNCVPDYLLSLVSSYYYVNTLCCKFVSGVLSFISSSYYYYSHSCSCSYRQFFHIKCDLVNYKRPLRIWPMYTQMIDVSAVLALSYSALQTLIR